MKKYLLLLLGLLASTAVANESLQIGDDGKVINPKTVVFALGHLEVNGVQVTALGNIFNGPNELLQLSSLGKLPALDGSALTGITKGQVGLANADNTSDADKPLSNAAVAALSAKEPSITIGVSTQYWRGDKTWQPLNKAAVGLSLVDNTSDLGKPISTLTATALAGKQDTSAKGSANGYAALGVDGKVPSSQLPAAAVGGTVTSVGLTMPAIFSVTGSPITGSGTFGVSYSSQTANSWWGVGSTDGPPAFRTTAIPSVLIPGLDGTKITSGFVPVNRLPVMVGVGGSHASGIVGDPGATGATTDYWARNATWHSSVIVPSITKTLAGDGTGGVVAAGAQADVIPSTPLSGTVVDWSVNKKFLKTLSANTTFTFSNDLDGQTIVIRILNTASNWTVTWPVAVQWPGGTQPTQTIGVRADIWTFTKDGTIISGAVSQNNF